MEGGEQKTFSLSHFSLPSHPYFPPHSSFPDLEKKEGRHCASPPPPATRPRINIHSPPFFDAGIVEEGGRQ